MRLSSFLKVGRSWWKLIQTENISPEYQQWRHRFILKRLYLMSWVAIVYWLMYMFPKFPLVVGLLNPSSPPYEFYLQNFWLLLNTRIVEFIQLMLALLLFKISLVRRYPLLVFLWLISALFLTEQISYTIFLKQIVLAENTWQSVFPIVAVLMPVKWRWYLLAQGIVLGYFGIGYLLFGLRQASVSNGLEYFTGVYSTVIVFLIVNLGVSLYEKLLQQEFELRRQLKLFVYTVSHDLRSPVLGTLFLLKSLRNSAAKKTVVENEIIDQMIDSSDRQLQLIDSLLEVHSTETKAIAIRPRQTCINHLVQSVITDMQPFFERDRAVVTTKIPAKLPLVNIDPLQIRRVYENIIANALEHNQTGLHLTLEAKHNNSLSDRQIIAGSDRWIYCTISDDGEGIPPHLRSQLFSLYTRAASKKQSLSMGLGLYICQQIIDAHGGKIGVNDTQQGASFWFTLPITTQIDNSR